jgi:hypothetical protein
MRKNINSALKIVGLVVILSFMLTGCYTQLSRPRVDTEDEYYNNTQYDDEEYYQDEGVQDPAIQEGGDTYIYNYYSQIDPYFDYWNYYPYYPYSWNSNRWSYLGPYPDYWWDPVGRWWTPGWYAGFYYHDSWWGGSSRYRHSNYGYYSNPSQRTYTQRPFGRRSIDTADRQQRIVDTQSGLARPQSPTRVERPTTTLASPDLRNKPVSKDATRVPATGKQVRTRPATKNSGVSDDARRQTTVKPRTPVRRSEPQKVSPRSSKSYPKPKMIETAPPKKNNKDNSKSYNPTQRSNRSNSAPARSNDTRVSKPSTRSSAPRSSATTKSSSSSTSSSSKQSSSSESSGSSKKNKK